MADRVLHIVKVGKAQIGIILPKVYGDIKDVVGIREATDQDVVDDNGTVGDLKRRARIVTFKVRTKDKKSHTLQCSIDKVSSAVGTLKGKTFGGSTITSVSIPRRRSRR
jgi:hypothetical protein